MKCQNCINGKTVLSENGYHIVCCLPDKQAMRCLLGKPDKKIVTVDFSGLNKEKR
jgi:hypothetical protein